MPQSRTASIERKTRETLVRVKLNLDGEGTSETNTGIGFLDHMLDQLAFPGHMTSRFPVRGTFTSIVITPPKTLGLQSARP